MKNRKISWIVTKNKKKSHHPREKITLQWLKMYYKHRIIQAQNQKRLITDKCALQICRFIFPHQATNLPQGYRPQENKLPYLNRI